MTDRSARPLGFDEIAVDDTWTSPARTVTEADVTMFACLTGDWNPLHVDHEHARGTAFGRPIAHGLLGLSLMAGLASRSPWMRTAAFVRIVEWKFLKPIYFGDTVHVQSQVLGIEPRSKGRRALVRVPDVRL